jgi:hypothetical protein
MVSSGMLRRVAVVRTGASGAKVLRNVGSYKSYRA